MMRLSYSLIATLAILAQVGCGASPAPTPPGAPSLQSHNSQHSAQPASLAAPERPTEPNHSDTSLASDAAAPRNAPATVDRDDGRNLPDFTDSRQGQKPQTVASAPLKSEHSKSPYDGIKSEKVSLYKRLEAFITPILKDAAAVSDRASNEIELSNAIVEMGRFNITLDPPAEKQLRIILSKLESMESNFVVSPADRNSSSYLMSIHSVSPDGFHDRLRSLYEDAIDSGHEFSPEVRRDLAQFLKAKGPSLPDFSQLAKSWSALSEATSPKLNAISLKLDYNSDHQPKFQIRLAELTNDLRQRILEQAVTGDDLFRIAIAIHERGTAVQLLRSFTKSYSSLVAALPPKSQFSFMFPYFCANDFADRLMTARNFTTYMLPQALSTLKFHFPKEFAQLPTLFLEAAATDESLRDNLETPFAKCDAAGWSVLLALDDLLGELRLILKATNPDLNYEFSPLISLDMRRSQATNTIPRLQIFSALAKSKPFIKSD